MSQSARRNLATLFAALALLCAQVAALPDLAPSSARPAAVTTPVELGVARVQSGYALVKAERSTSFAKSATPLDVLIPQIARPSHPSQRFGVALTAQAVALRELSTSPYRARAPPMLAASRDFSTLS